MNEKELSTEEIDEMPEWLVQAIELLKAEQQTFEDSQEQAGEQLESVFNYPH